MSFATAFATPDPLGGLAGTPVAQSGPAPEQGDFSQAMAQASGVPAAVAPVDESETAPPISAQPASASLTHRAVSAAVNAPVAAVAAKHKAASEKSPIAMPAVAAVPFPAPAQAHAHAPSAAPADVAALGDVPVSKAQASTLASNALASAQKVSAVTGESGGRQATQTPRLAAAALPRTAATVTATPSNAVADPHAKTVLPAANAAAPARLAPSSQKAGPLSASTIADEAKPAAQPASAPAVNPAAITSSDNVTLASVTTPLLGAPQPAQTQHHPIPSSAGIAPANAATRHPRAGASANAALPQAISAVPGSATPIGAAPVLAAAANTTLPVPGAATNTQSSPAAAPILAPVPANTAAALAATVTAMVKDGKSSVSIRLDPAELGSVSIHLAVGQDAKVNVLMLAAVPQTAQAFSAGADDLRQAFTASGLALGQLDVGGGSGGGTARQQAGRDAQDAPSNHPPTGQLNAADPNTAHAGVRAIA